MKAPEAIETARLVLRRPAADDVGAIFARYAADAGVTKYLSFPTHRSLDDTRGFLESSDLEWFRQPAGPYLIVARADGRLLGGTGLQFETPQRAVTGYVLARDAWGQGFATEALAALVALAPSLGIGRLTAHCHPAHGRSGRVLEKCGFVFEGTLRRYAEFPNLAPGVPSDVLSYSRIWGRSGDFTWRPGAAGYEVHSARAGDASAWLEMRRALWPGHEGDWHAGEVEQFFAGTLPMPMEVLIARDEHRRSVGFAELFIRPYAEGCLTGRVAFLEGWYVDPAFRRRGVGRALVRAAEEWARAQGCIEFASDAEIDNADSAAAHLALGFEAVDEIRCFRKSLR